MPPDSLLIVSFSHKAQTYSGITVKFKYVVLQRYLKFSHRIIVKPHFHICDTEVIVRLSILLAKLLFYTALEFGECLFSPRIGCPRFCKKIQGFFQPQFCRQVNISFFCRRFNHFHYLCPFRYKSFQSLQVTTNRSFFHSSPPPAYGIFYRKELLRCLNSLVWWCLGSLLNRGLFFCGRYKFLNIYIYQQRFLCLPNFFSSNGTLLYFYNRLFFSRLCLIGLNGCSALRRLGFMLLYHLIP